MSDEHKLYAERDPEALSPHYERHVSAMTREGLHSKADIAEELAWRDQCIEELERRLRAAEERAEKAEAERDTCRANFAHETGHRAKAAAENAALRSELALTLGTLESRERNIEDMSVQIAELQAALEALRDALENIASGERGINGSSKAARKALADARKEAR